MIGEERLMKPIATSKSKVMTKNKTVGALHAEKRGAHVPAWTTTKSFPISSMEIHSMISEIKRGYSLDKFEQLKEDLGVNKEKLAKIASISLATMHRRKIASGRLTSDESEKVYRLEKLYETALEVLENKDNVKAWFNTTQVVFEGKTPLEYADTMPGSEEVERVLRRMEHGIVL
jgi:putative toxin-antitoxin system antitoxin component (TIGR02293 family)